MSASIRLDGLRAMAKSLDRLPQALEAEAGRLMQATAVAAANDMRSGLPISTTTARPGNLRRGVRVVSSDPLVWQAVSGAPHAWINEYGTLARRNRRGANRGISPPSKAVARIAGEQRRQMNARLEGVLSAALEKAERDA